jgi:two-component sensor histidine kinase
MMTHPLTLHQLRHHTRNSCKRILFEIHDDASWQHASRDRHLQEQLANRIRQSIQLLDAVFGTTSEPAPFSERFHTLCRGLLSLFADPAQHLRLDISLKGTCPPVLEMAALCATHEFVGNAVRHGMYLRLIGRVAVSLTCRSEAVELVVTDDGWGPAAAPKSEQGFSRDLAEQFRGTLSVGRRDEHTVAMITLRTTRCLFHEPAAPSAGDRTARGHGLAPRS